MKEKETNKLSKMEELEKNENEKIIQPFNDKSFDAASFKMNLSKPKHKGLFKLAISTKKDEEAPLENQVVPGPRD